MLMLFGEYSRITLDLRWQKNDSTCLSATACRPMGVARTMQPVSALNIHKVIWCCAMLVIPYGFLQPNGPLVKYCRTPTTEDSLSKREVTVNSNNNNDNQSQLVTQRHLSVPFSRVLRMLISTVQFVLISLTVTILSVMFVMNAITSVAQVCQVMCSTYCYQLSVLLDGCAMAAELSVDAILTKLTTLAVLCQKQQKRLQICGLS